MGRLTVILCLCALVTACGGATPPAPPAPKPLTGTERLAWDQKAATADDATAIHYVVFIDNGERKDMENVTCGTEATAAGFPCSGKLPTLPPGHHVIQLASVASDGTRQSPLSDPLPVEVAAAASSP